MRTDTMILNDASLFELCKRLAHVERLLKASGGQLQIAIHDVSAGWCRDPEILALAGKGLQRILAGMHITAPKVVDGNVTKLNSVELALTTYLSICVDDVMNRFILPGEKIAGVLNNIAATMWSHTTVSASDKGLPFDVYHKGCAEKEAVIIVPPCGVPASLFTAWMDALADSHLVITYENPVLFGNQSEHDLPSSAIQYEADLISRIIKKLGLSKVHLLGICGGAVSALHAANQPGNAIASTTVCHGDIYFGDSGERTAFQQQFSGLLLDSAASEKNAQPVHRLFLDPAVLLTLKPGIAPFVLYPYLNTCLFRRYADMNAKIMTWNSTDTAATFNGRLMVITSENDRMTPKQSSVKLHSMVAGSQLYVRPEGNHHDALLPVPEILNRFKLFVAEAI